MDSLKHFSSNLTKTIVTIALIVLTTGIFSCSTKLMTSKKHSFEKESPVVKEFTISVDGADLYCKVIGEGQPILFIHGGPGLVHNYFLPYMQCLLPYGYQLIFYDQRGNGKSPSFNLDSIKLDVFVQDIERIREKFEIEKLVLFTHSAGGYLAYLYALKYPQHIDAIIFCDNGPLTDKGMEEFSSN
jgi:proline-specific peptidase